MNRIALVFVMNIPAMILAVSAAVLAYHNINGWGWFVFGAMMLAVTSWKK